MRFLRLVLVAALPTILPGSLVGSTATALQAAGAKLVTPEMPWSRSGMYDVTYEQAMIEIDRAVAPKHPKCRYVEVNANHANTPDVAKADVVAWLKSI